MLTLRTADPSPFGRKVKIAAKLTGHYDTMTIERADTNNPDDSLRQQNPLGKIPALVLEDGTTLYDSRVICEYFDAHSKGKRLIPDGDARWDTLRLQALADGMMDAGVLQVYEKRFRPEEIHYEPWLAHQRGKVERGLAALEAAPPASSDAPTIGEVALACALGYLDIRFEGAWRETYPKLVAWLDAFAAQIPAFEETTPQI